MFKSFKNALRSVSRRRSKQPRTIKHKHFEDPIPKSTLSNNLEENRLALQNVLGPSPDITFRDVKIGGLGIQALLVYIDGLVENSIINDNIIKPFTFEASLTEAETRKLTIDFIRENILSASDVKDESSFQQLLKLILTGHTAIIIQGFDTALIVSAIGTHAMRAVSVPIIEGEIKGPQEGFVETLRINTALIRRKLNSPKLRFEETTIGTITQTTVCVAYLDGITDEALINEVNQRLNRIEIDGILESNYLEELIGDAPYSPFPTIMTTERPDTVAAHLMEGKVAILTDGTPFVMIVPVTFSQFLTASEDYYKSFYFSSAVRILRYISFLMSLFLPSTYIALISFHHEMLPSALAISIAAARQGIPFPSLLEALIMELAFEILREGSIRLPRPIGQSISIVGALVIGEAVVRAGLVSPIMVIIVSATAIASFTIPRYTMSLSFRMLRFPIMLLSATLGFFGLMMGGFIIFVHLTSLRSFGVPFFGPMAPANLRDQKDTFIRIPWWSMTTRPLDTGHLDTVRAKSGMKPKKPPKKSKR